MLDNHKPQIKNDKGIEMRDRINSVSKFLKEKVCFIIKKTPIISGLPDLKPSDHAGAFKEASVTIILATMPLWLGAFIAALIDNSYGSSGFFEFIKTILDKLVVTAQSGILIAYAATLVAPVLYLALSEIRTESKVKFPSQISHVMVVLMVTVISAAYYTATLIKEDGLNSNIVQHTSLILFSFSIIVYYVALCYKYFTNTYNHATTVSKSSRDFSSRFKEFIGSDE